MAQERKTQDEQAESKARSRGPALNRVELIGRVVKDPDVRATGEGQFVTSIRLVTNEGEDPEFHDLTAFGKTADIAGTHLRKGRLVYVEGRLHSSTWTTERGESRRRTEVRVNRLQMLDRQEGSSA